MNTIASLLQDLALAIQFLTRLPVPLRTAPGPERMASSVRFYPLVGALIGAILALARRALSVALPPLPAAAVVVAAWAGLTGAMHLDGLMDAADGLLSNRERARALEIMKDGRSGPMGVAAGVIVLMLKFSAVASMTGATAGGGLVAAAVAGRAAVATCTWAFPYARQTGMGSFSRIVRPAPVVAGAILGIALAGVAGRAGGLAAVAGGMAAGMLTAAAAGRALGGLTGDVYGAVCELAEATALLVWVGWRS